MKKGKQSNKQGDNYTLVYSTDPIKEKSSQIKETKKLSPAVRFERKGRAGKSVTVIYKLPANATLLEKLLKSLKRSLGTGGTSYIEDGQGFIEVQGEHTEKVLELIAENRG